MAKVIAYRKGRCRFCLCTQNKACPGGCCWVDRSKTICSACALPTPPDWKILQDRLLMMSLKAPLATIGKWSNVTRAKVNKWAIKSFLRASDNIVVVPPTPSVVKTLAQFSPEIPLGNQ